MDRLFSSLRVRLVLFVFLAMLPAFGLIFYQAQVQRQNIERLVEEQAIVLALRESGSQSDSTRDAEAQLSMLAHLFSAEDTSLKSIDRTECNEVLSSVRLDGSIYAAMGVIDADGVLICSSPSISGHLNLANRGYFQSPTDP